LPGPWQCNFLPPLPDKIQRIPALAGEKGLLVTQKLGFIVSVP